MAAETDVCGSEAGSPGKPDEVLARWGAAGTLAPGEHGSMPSFGSAHSATTLQRHGKSLSEPKPLSTVQWNVKENAADRKLRGQMIHPTGPPH